MFGLRPLWGPGTATQTSVVRIHGKSRDPKDDQRILSISLTPGGNSMTVTRFWVDRAKTDRMELANGVRGKETRTRSLSNADADAVWDFVHARVEVRGSAPYAGRLKAVVELTNDHWYRLLPNEELAQEKATLDGFVAWGHGLLPPRGRTGEDPGPPRGLTR